MPLRSGFNAGRQFAEEGTGRIAESMDSAVQNAGKVVQKRLDAIADRIAENKVGSVAARIAKGAVKAGGATLFAGGAVAGAAVGAGRKAADGARAIADYSSVNMFIIFAILVHILKWSLRFDNSYTWSIDVAFAIIVLFFFFNRENRTAEVIRGVIIVCILEIFLPTILGVSSAVSQNTLVKNYLLNRYLTPWWFYYAIAVAGNHTKLSLWMRRIVVIFWIGVLITTLPSLTFTNLKDSYAGPEQLEVATGLWGRSVDFWKTTWTSLEKGIKSLPEAWEHQLDLATGGYYTGRVDENQKEPLGVYIENLKTSAPEFYLGETPSIYGTLRVKTLDDGIKVVPSCYWGEKDSNGDFLTAQKGDASPSDIPRIYDLERQDIDCIYKGGISVDTSSKSSITGIKEGSNKATMQVKFNFETMAYLKTYFMDKDRIRSMATQGIDPLGHYGITDKNPIARYTNGPVMIGIGFSEPPIGVSDNNLNLRLGVTLESNAGWEGGKIAEIKELVIQLPDSLELDLASCNAPFIDANKTDYQKICVEGYRKYRSKQFVDCRTEYNLEDDDFDEDGYPKTEAAKTFTSELEECLMEQYREEEGYNSYLLDVSKNPQSLRNIERYKTFSCTVKVKSAQALLGNSPVSTQYIRARARYDYLIEKSTTFVVKVPRDDKGTMIGIPDGVSQTSEAPSPTDAGRASQIFNWYYNRDPQPIKKAVDEFQSDSTLLTPCLVVGIISVETGGYGVGYKAETAVSGKGCKGLMQVESPTGAEVAKAIGIEKYEDSMLLTPTVNIRIGTYYIKKKIEFYKSKSAADADLLSYALAGYNAGDGRVTTAADPSITGANCCPGGKCIPFSECLPKLPKETQKYVPSVLKYKTACEQLDLPSMGVWEEEAAKENPISSTGTLGGIQELESSKKIGQRVVVPEIDGSKNKFSYILEKTTKTATTPETPTSPSITSTEDLYSLDLFFGSSNTAVATNLVLDEDQIVYSTKYPFIRFRKTSDSIDHQYFKKSVVNVELEKDAKLPTGDKIYTVAWTAPSISDDRHNAEYIYARYEGSNIVLYSKDNNLNKVAFCTVPLTETYGTCRETVPGIIIRNMNAKSPTAGKAYIQIEYDPNYEAICCKNGCNCDKDIDRGTCSECENGLGWITWYTDIYG